MSCILHTFVCQGILVLFLWSLFSDPLLFSLQLTAVYRPSLTAAREVAKRYGIESYHDQVSTLSLKGPISLSFLRQLERLLAEVDFVVLEAGAGSSLAPASSLVDLAIKVTVRAFSCLSLCNAFVSSFQGMSCW